MVNVYKTKLDIKAVKHVFKPVFVQYDHARLEIELLDGGLPYSLTNVSRVEFTHVRKDGAVIIHPGEIVTIGSKSVVCYDYQGTEMDELGVVQASFALFNAENRKVSPHKFEVVIRQDLRDETFNPAEPNYGLLQTLIADVEYVKENGGSGGVGPQGERGLDGYTPVKGVDYFDGVNGRDGAQGPKGDPFMYADFTTTQLDALRGPMGHPGDSSNVVISKQKANYETVLLNSRVDVNSGSITSNSSGFVTFDYMEIEEGTTNIIIARNYNIGGANPNNIAYYDSDKNFISGFNTGSTSPDSYGRLNLIPPINAKYFRFSVQGIHQRVGIFLNSYSQNFNHYNYYESNKSKWFGKKVVGYGDSLVAGTSNSIETWLGIVAGELGYEPCNRGIGGSTVLQSDTTRTAYIADGVTNLSVGEYGELVNRPVEHGGTATSKPPGTVEIASSMCTDARVNTIPTDADAIIILAGANGMDESSYRLMLQKIYTRCPEAIIFCCSHTFRYSDDAKTQIFDSTSLNTVIKNLCQEFGSHYIDLKGLEGVNQYNQSIYLSDRIHANLTGNQRRAMAISSVLKAVEPLT